jgi:hypothetical protein
MYRGTRREPVLVILFSVLTCGIYYLYWLYQVKNDVNGLLGREEISTGWYVAAIFVPFLYLYLLYKADLALVEVCPQRGVNYTSNFTLWLLLTLLGVGIYVAMFQITTTLNELWGPDAG